MAKDSLSDHINELKALLAEYQPHVEEALGQAHETLQKEAKKALDEKPLMTLGLTAVVFLILGFVFGRCGKSK